MSIEFENQSPDPKILKRGDRVWHTNLNAVGTVLYMVEPDDSITVLFDLGDERDISIGCLRLLKDQTVPVETRDYLKWLPPIV